MSPWLENLAALHGRFPVAAARVAAAAAGQPAPTRSPALSRRIAQRWLGDRTWGEGAFVAVSGFADGAHVRALLERVAPQAWVFVAEPDAGALRAALEQEDFAALLRDRRILLGVGAVDEAFFAPLREVPVLEVTEVEALVFAPSYNRAPEACARFFTECARQVDFRRKLFGTAVVDAELWQANTFANLPLLAAAPDVAALRDAFRGHAMVLVSAGPSLDESLEFVRRASERSLVVAVNSSYRAVRRAGIVPPLVLAADPRGFTARGFAGVPVDGTWLVTTPIVDPAVVRLFPGRVFTWSGGNALWSGIRQRCGLPAGTTLIEQGTVSACAVDLAVLLGCDRVCLVGQDLAVRGDGRSHASDSFYTDLQANHADVNRCRLLPGNTLPQVPVEEKLYVYLKTFTQLVTQRPQLRFLNTARLGARIEGVPYADFEEAFRWMEAPVPEPPAAVIARAFASGDPQRLDPARARTALSSTSVYARSVLTAALRAAQKLESLAPRLEAENYRDSPAVRDALDAAAELRRLLDRQPREYAILEGGRTRLELHRSREAQARLPARTDHWRRILVAREWVWAIAEGAWFLDTQLRRLAAAAPAAGTPA